jgi:serine protease inhibitor
MSGDEVTGGVNSCVYLNGTWKCIFDVDMTQDINFYLLLNGKKSPNLFIGTKDLE